MEKKDKKITPRMLTEDEVKDFYKRASVIVEKFEEIMKESREAPVAALFATNFLVERMFKNWLGFHLRMDGGKYVIYEQTPL